MNENKFIDAVLTSDSDAILFGARYVIRRQVTDSTTNTLTKLKSLSRSIQYNGRLESFRQQRGLFGI